MHNSCLFLHTQFPGEHILHGSMDITFKYYPSVVQAKLTSFEGCIVNIIYHDSCENMFSNFTSTLQEQPGCPERVTTDEELAFGEEL